MQIGGRTGFSRDDKKITFTKRYRRQEVVESYGRQRPERSRLKEEEIMKNIMCNHSLSQKYKQKILNRYK